MMPHSTMSGDPDSDDPNIQYTISEEQDLLMSFDLECPGPYQPPAHIMARIYKAKDRRKSSATSSRRNSMTSHHSSRSARSGHGKPLSTHVAQQLRRASILESRKAKAADRNAHAEEVRSRAAMLRAAPRVAANSEGRALAAQQARERYLAQVKANCAEEVKRSKRVAEEQREKRAAEHLKLKEDMEERHAEAEKRKNLIQQNQRRPRTATLPTTESKVSTYTWKPSSRDQAARTIQRVWRDRQWASAIQGFLSLEVNVEILEKMAFEEAGELLSQEHVLSCTSRTLAILKLKDKNDDEAQERGVVRTFLSAFLILSQPAHVLSKDGEEERDLVRKARDLLDQFNHVIYCSDRLSASVLLEGLSDAYISYQTAFTSWRSNDNSYMVSGMLAQFVELDAIWQLVKHDGDAGVTQDYKEGIQHNQTLILAKLKRLAGPEKAMKMIKDAIRARRKSKAKKSTEAKVDSKPRAASNALVAPAVSTLAAVGTEPADTTRSLNTPSSLKTTARSRLEASSLVPHNRIVTHEIAINKEWKIDAEPKPSARDEIVTAISRDLQNGLDAGLGDIWIPAMAETIREKLLALLTPGNSLHNLVSEALDPTLVAQQVKQGTFSYEKLFAFMDNILPQICAPVRDPEVKALASNPSVNPVEQLARLYYILDLNKLDMLNFTLQRMAPTLLGESAGYEARYFAREMNGKFPDRTLQWWKSSAVKANEEASRRSSSDPITSNNHGISPNKIYLTGLIDLATGTTPLSPFDLPETLSLDLTRLNRIRHDILRTITTSSILLTAKNLLRRDVRSLWKLEAQRMWELPFSSPPSAFVSIVESRYALPATTKQQLHGTITRLLVDARSGGGGEGNNDTNTSSNNNTEGGGLLPTHPVMKVLLKKIKLHFWARLSAASAEERIRASTTATEVLGAGGMPEFVTRIGDMVNELGRVAEVDREAHGSWYDQVAERAAAAEER